MSSTYLRSYSHRSNKKDLLSSNTGLLWFVHSLAVCSARQKPSYYWRQKNPCIPAVQEGTKAPSRPVPNQGSSSVQGVVLVVEAVDLGWGNLVAEAFALETSKCCCCWALQELCPEKLGCSIRQRHIECYVAACDYVKNMKISWSTLLPQLLRQEMSPPVALNNRQKTWPGRCSRLWSWHSAKEVKTKVINSTPRRLIFIALRFYILPMQIYNLLCVSLIIQDHLVT